MARVTAQGGKDAWVLAVASWLAGLGSKPNSQELEACSSSATLCLQQVTGAKLVWRTYWAVFGGGTE